MGLSWRRHNSAADCRHGRNHDRRLFHIPVLSRSTGNGKRDNAVQVIWLQGELPGLIVVIF
jgi:hypothetical protein